MSSFKIMAPKTYRLFYENPDNNPSGSEAERLEFAKITSAIYDTSKNEDEMLTEVMIDIGLATEMNGGHILFVEATNKLGGTVQVLHNMVVHPSGDHCNAPFDFYNYVEIGAVESVLFQKALLAETDEMIVLATMERLLQNFTTNEAVDFVGLYVDNQVFTKRFTPRNPMFLHFALIP